MQKTIGRLTQQGVSRLEALQYIRRYVVDMERGEGLYATKGVGPVTGYTLENSGITDPKVLAKSTLPELETLGIRDGRAKTILESARSQTGVAPPGTTSESGEMTDLSSPQLDELPVVTYDGHDITANPLSEYYESIRSTRKVISTVMQLAGTDINPDDLTDPRVQYYVMLDACIGYGHPDSVFTGFGMEARPMKRSKQRCKLYVHDHAGPYPNGPKTVLDTATR